ncbi:MAG: VIT1/CCC1 transporter family protein [Candidatus Hodarchaeales archaeon]
MISIKKIRDLIKLGGSGNIAKRYLVMNSFDGALTALGLIIGNWLVGIKDPRVLIVGGLGASIAMGVSGAFGAYLTETAVKKEEMAVYESAMLESFEDTVIDEASAFSSYFVAFIDGFSPFMAASISFFPFILVMFFTLDINIAYMASFVLTGFSLFSLGTYLGKISKTNLYINGLKMILAGFIVGILVLIIEFASKIH